MENEFVFWFNNTFIEWTIQYSYSASIQQSNVDSITVFWKTTLPTSRPQNFFFLLFSFSKSRVRESSEVQTQTNCYMYAIFLPVISATDLTSLKTRWSNWGQCMYGDWWISILGPCQFLWVYDLSILPVILIKGNEKRNRKIMVGKGK